MARETQGAAETAQTAYARMNPEWRRYGNAFLATSIVHCQNPQPDPAGAGLPGNLMSVNEPPYRKHHPDRVMPLLRRRQAPHGAIMLKILVPLDGSPNALRAIDYLAALARNNTALHCELLYVREPFGVREHGYRTHEQLASLDGAAAQQALQPAQAMLDAAGIPYAAASIEGDIGHTIVNHAAKAGCDSIAMGMRGMGFVFGPFSMGSVTAKVLHLATMPVTLVK
jgi:nucleotide-binding universal stress UspA family protein